MGGTNHPAVRTLLGEILLERGLITKEDLTQALKVQVGGQRRLGHILIRMKRITGEDLTGALSQQLGLPVVAVAEEVRAGVEALLPRYLCRKYGVIPLSLEPSNVLRLAMADPLDAGAIADVENYTGRAVQPVLAGHADIDLSIPRRVAFSRDDLLNLFFSRTTARVAVAAAVVLLLVTGLLTFRMVHEQRFGTVSRVGDSLIYKNLDLMIDQGGDGTVYFSGRGAHAAGYYGIRFESPLQLKSFVTAAAGQLSAEQREWVDWVLSEKLRPGEAPVASN